MARAVDELKRGRAVRIESAAVLAVELADEASLADLETNARADLLLEDFLLPDATVFQMQRNRAAMVDAAPAWP